MRFPVEFFVESTEPVKRVCIASARLNEESPCDFSGKPSRVLRRLEPRESVWDLAKSCHSTIADLLAANQLEDESAIPHKQLLLIPRKRA